MDLANLIRKNLTPDLLIGKWKKKTHIPLAGYCYVASEALYHLLGKDKKYWTPTVSRLGKETHWYLTKKETGDIVDITGDQYDWDTLRSLYFSGRNCGFLTKQPSKRAKILIKKVKNVLRNQKMLFEKRSKNNSKP